MSSGWTKPSSAGRTRQSAGNKFPNKTRSCDGSTGNSSEESRDFEEEFNSEDELTRIFRKVVEPQFAKLEERLTQMEEQHYSAYNLTKKNAKTLEALNAMQKDVFENPEDLIAKIHAAPKIVPEIQKNNPVHLQGPKHTTESSLGFGEDYITKKPSYSEMNQRILEDLSGVKSYATKCFNEIQSVLIQRFNSVLEEFSERTNIQSEILNSIEDLKILVSSVPNTVNDMIPLIGKIEKSTTAFPDDINATLAALEENLCANLVESVKRINGVNFKQINSLVDTSEQRLLVDRKYVKHGGQGNLETASNEASAGNKICCLAPSTASHTTLGPTNSDAGNQRAGKMKATKMYSPANELKPKYTSSSVKKLGTPPSRPTKRLSSSLAGHSIADPSSEAPEHGESAVESSIAQKVCGKMSAADRIGRGNWGPKRKRSCYGDTQAAKKCNGEAATINVPGQIM